MKIRIAGLCLALTFSAATSAQEKPAPTYRLQFRLQETRPSATRTAPATRNYLLLLQGKSRGKINASRRLPYYTSTKGDAKELHTAALGTIIECSAADREGGVQLDCAFESSFVAREQPAPLPPIEFLPVMISRQVTAAAVVPIGKEVRFAGIDDPNTNSRLEIFLSAERFDGPVR